MTSTSLPLPADTPVARPVDRSAEYLLVGQIVAATLLQKVAINLTADVQLFLGFLILAALTGLGIAFGKLELRPVRCIFYMAAMAVMGFVQLFHMDDFSLPSLIMLMLVHLPYVFGLRPGLARPGIELELYVRVMAAFALLGIIQYFAQYAVGVPLAFPMEYYFPESLHVTGFNSLNAIKYGADHYKSTGVFFLEPAIFCQFLSLAVVIDLIYFRNWKRLALLATAIAVTFSGTGLIMIFLLLPFFMIEQKKYVSLLVFGVVIVSSPLWAPAVGLGSFVSRVSEFSNPNSSGFARFISMFFVLRDFVAPYPDNLLFGIGAGSIGATIPRQVDYANFDPTWGKIIYEYGVFAAMAYFAFLAALFSSARRSRYLKAALLIQFLVLGGYIIPPTIHGLIVALIAWPEAKLIPRYGEAKEASV